MGKALAATRVIANFCGKDQILFSFRESNSATNNGGIYISEFASPPYTDWLTGLTRDTKEIRLSVHVSPSAIGHEVIDHIEFRGDEKPSSISASSHAVIDAEHSKWLLTSHLFSARSTEFLPFKAKANESVIDLGKYAEYESIIVLMWLSRVDIPREAPFPNIISLEFSTFRFYIEYHRLYQPCGKTIRAFWATKPRKVDGVVEGAPWGQAPRVLSAFDEQWAGAWARQQLCNLLYQESRTALNKEGVIDTVVAKALPGVCSTAWVKEDEGNSWYPIADPLLFQEP